MFASASRRASPPAACARELTTQKTASNRSCQPRRLSASPVSVAVTTSTPCSVANAAVRAVIAGLASVAVTAKPAWARPTARWPKRTRNREPRPLDVGLSWPSQTPRSSPPDSAATSASGIRRPRQERRTGVPRPRADTTAAPLFERTTAIDGEEWRRHRVEHATARASVVRVRFGSGTSRRVRSVSPWRTGRGYDAGCSAARGDGNTAGRTRSPPSMQAGALSAPRPVSQKRSGCPTYGICAGSHGTRSPVASWFREPHGRHRPPRTVRARPDGRHQDR